MLNFISRKWSKPINSGQFHSINHILEFVQSIPRQALNDTNSESTNSSSIDFTGSQSLPHAYELANSGHHEIVKALNKKKIKCNVQNAITTYNLDFFGEQIDVGLHLLGEPECFIKQDQIPNKKYIALIIQVGAACDISQESILEYCIKVSEEVKTYIQKGYLVKVICVNNSDISFYSIVIKNYETSFSISNLVTILHPSFFRRILFRLIEQQDNFKQNYGVFMKPYKSDLQLLHTGEYKLISIEDTKSQYKPEPAQVSQTQETITDFEQELITKAKKKVDVTEELKRISHIPNKIYS